MKWRSVIIQILILSWQVVAIAQSPISGVLKNAEGAVISYASIAYRSTRVGAVSGEDGKFTIQKRAGDTLRFSALGYQPVEFRVDDTTTFVQLQLQFDTRQLPQVVVGETAHFRRRISIGHFTSRSNYWNYLGPEVQEAVFIPNTAALNGIISSIDFRLAEYRESKFLLRIRLMKRDPASGKPGEDLLFSENLVKPGRFKRNFSLKLKETSIPLPPDGVFVTFEWIPVNNKVEKNEKDTLYSRKLKRRQIL